MKLNNIHNDLKELYKNNNTFNHFIFEIESRHNETSQLIQMYKKGYWYIVPFAFEDKNIIGLKLTPNVQNEELPVVLYNATSKNAITFAPNIKSTIVMSIASLFNESETILQTKKNIDKIIEYVIPFLRYLKEENTMGIFKKYLLNPKNQILFENAKSESEKFFTDLWELYNNTNEEKKKRNLLNQLIDNESYIPDYNVENYTK